MGTQQTLTMQRVLGGVPTLALFKPPQCNAVRVRVLRGTEWVDITNRVKRGTITESNDQAMMTLDLELLNGVGFPSLAPRRTDSELNIVDNEYDPLLWPGRQIFIEAASSTDGSTPDQWHPVFHGVLGDDIDSNAMPNTVIVGCRDQAKWLLDDHIVGPVAYEKMYASQTIQQILIDRYNANGIPVQIPFRAIGSDDHWVERYVIENQTAWQAIQSLVDQSGYDARFKLDEGDGKFKLTYWLPSTDMSQVDWIVTGSDIRAETLKISDVQLRNRVEVAYRDAQGNKKEVVATNNQLPVRLCRIEEGDTSTLRDAASAQAFADRVLGYLQDLHATDELTIPFNPYVSLFDVIEVENDRIRSNPERYSVDSRTLEFSANSWSLSLAASGSVGVRPQRWIEKETRPGVKRPWEPVDSTTNQPMPTPTGVQAKGIPGGISITFDEPDPKRWAETWVYVSSTSPVDLGTAPAVRGRSIPLEVTGIEAGQQRYARIVHVDQYGNPSPPSTEVVAIAEGYTEAPDTTQPNPPTGLTAIPVVGGFVLTWDRHEAPPPLDRYVLERASSEDGFASWVTVNDEIRSAYYSDLGLDSKTEYQYRLTVITRAQVPSLPSDPTTPALPGKVSLSEQTLGNILGTRVEEGTLPADAFDQPLQQARAKWDDSGEFVEQLAVQAIGPDEISSAVGEVYPDGTGAQSAIQQNATSIAQRLMVVDANNQPVVAAQIQIAQKDGQGNILVQADNILLDGSVKAKHLDADSVTAQKIAADAITTEKIAAEAITADKIKANTITVDRIIAGNLLGFVVASGNVTMPSGLNPDGTFGVRIPLPKAYPRDDVTVLLEPPNQTIFILSYQPTLGGGPWFLSELYPYYVPGGLNPKGYVTWTQYWQGGSDGNYPVVGYRIATIAQKPSGSLIDEVFITVASEYGGVYDPQDGSMPAGIQVFGLLHSQYTIRYAIIVRESGEV